MPDLQSDWETKPAGHGAAGPAAGVSLLALGAVGRVDALSIAVEAPPSRTRRRGFSGSESGLPFYTRRGGETAWRLLAAKRQRFPDDDPLTVAGTPETREYRAIGVEATTRSAGPATS